jgi:hypothetical protein
VEGYGEAGTAAHVLCGRRVGKKVKRKRTG